MKAVIGRIKYDTEKAVLIASNRYWDGSNWIRYGRNIYLWRSPNGRYFSTNITISGYLPMPISLWEGERNTLIPLSLEEAIRLYEELPKKEMEFEEAFPDVKVEEA